MRSLPCRLVLLVSLILVASACVDEPPSPVLVTVEGAVHTVCGGEETLPGIDVSHWQGVIDWDAVAASGQAAFAYIRIGDGLGVDSQFARNWPEARRVGIPRGAYQFFRPNRDPIEQAEHFLAMVDASGGHQPGDLPPLIDVEADGGQTPAVIRDRVAAWMDHVEAATGMRPIIYTGSYFWDDHVASDAFADDHLWTAHYTTASCPLVPNAWDRWTIWQYTSQGTVAGITGDVDRNRFNGTAEELALWPECSRFNPISDCLAPDWWCGPIGTLVDLGLLEAGCEAWRSDDAFSRADWAAVLGGALQLEQTDAYDLCRLPFSDVAADAPYARHVAALAALDRGDGETVFAVAEPDPRFNPDATTTRCQAVKTVAEAWGVAAADDLVLQYSDADAIPAWCRPSVQRLARAGVIAHGAEAFRGGDPLLIGEGAAIVESAVVGLGRPTPQPGDFNDPSCQPPDVCADQCALGDAQCVGVDVTACETAANGCADWGQPARCPLREACDAGQCAPACDDQCALETARCEGERVQVCLGDANGCRVWITADPCPEGAACVDGACVDPCALPGASCGDDGGDDGGAGDGSAGDGGAGDGVTDDAGDDDAGDDGGAFGDADGSDGGCAVAAPRRSTSGAWPLIGLGLLAASRRRRRQR